MDATKTNLEPLTRVELRMIARHLGPIQAMVCRLGEADPTRGKLKTRAGRCIWTESGRRIDFEVLPGGFVAAVGNEPDPEAPAHGTFPEG